MPVNMSPTHLATKIKQIYADNPIKAEARIKQYLEDRLGAFALTDRIRLLQRVALQFDEGITMSENTAMDDAPPAPEPSIEIEKTIIAKLFPLLLGKKALHADMTSEAELEILAQALNTIFDTLNRLINLIQTTLRGASPQQETIRGLIGRGLTDENEATQSTMLSLADHLGQIEEAFLLSQKGTKEAALAVAKDILTELDPDRLERQAQKGWVGLPRKARLYRMLKEKHQRCRDWCQSDRFEERLLREFEKSCSKHFKY